MSWEMAFIVDVTTIKYQSKKNDMVCKFKGYLCKAVIDIGSRSTDFRKKSETKLSQ